MGSSAAGRGEARRRRGPEIYEHRSGSQDLKRGCTAAGPTRCSHSYLHITAGQGPLRLHRIPSSIALRLRVIRLPGPSPALTLTAACRGGLDRVLRSAPLPALPARARHVAITAASSAPSRPPHMHLSSHPPRIALRPHMHYGLLRLTVVFLWLAAPSRLASPASRAWVNNNKAVSLPAFVVRCRPRPDSARFLDPSISPAPAESGWVAKPSTDLDGKPPLIIYGTAIRLSVGAVCACSGGCDRIQFA